MESDAVVQLLGGLGMFLLGIHHLTEGLKGLAGDSLRVALQRMVAGRFSAVASGVVFTALVQSSTAATLTVIGFVSAGLVTFAQAVGVIIGTTLGTTTTPWMVAYFGFQVSISSGALPLLGVGAFLWLIAKGKLRSLGAILAGFGLLFTGIEFLQDGMRGVDWNLDDVAGEGPGARWILAGIGVVMTVVMQSSSAAAATTIVALHAGSLSFGQGCAKIVGQSLGSAATTALVAIGGSLAVRRSAMAHVSYSAVVALLGVVFLGPLVSAAEWVGARLDDPDGVLALAAFSTTFKLAGVLVFYPWIDSFAQLIVRISGKGSETQVSRLSPVLANAGGAVALEAAWRAVLELARGAVGAVERRLANQGAQTSAPAEGVQQIEHFLESLRLETTDLATVGPRLVRLAHALDHLAALQVDLQQIPASSPGAQAPAGFAAGAQALAAWLATTGDPEAAPAPALFERVEQASKQLSAERQVRRDQLLEDIALQRTPSAAARADLDALLWADAALYKAWRLIHSLRLASGEGA